MENRNEHRLLKILLGDDYMNNFKVVHKLSDIPMEMVTKFWGLGEAERYFNHYMKHGKFFLVKIGGQEFLIHQNNDGLIMISNENDQNIKPEKFEHILGLSYVGLSIEEFLNFLLKNDNRISESDMNRLVKQIISNL